MKTYFLFVVWIVCITYLSIWLNAEGENGQLTFVSIGALASTMSSIFLFKDNQKRGDTFTYFKPKKKDKS